MANGYQSREIDPVPTSGLNSTGSTIPKGHIVCRGAGETIVLASAATDAYLGVTGQDIPNGSYGRVVTRGVVPVMFAAAQTVGARLAANADGHAAAAAAGNAVLGLAREVGAAGVLAEVELLGPGGAEMPG